jgi:hypothetical protein
MNGPLFGKHSSNLIMTEFLTILEQLNTLQANLLNQLLHITETLAEEELPPIHQNMLRRGDLLASLEQLPKPETIDKQTLITFHQLDSEIAVALTAYQTTLQKRLNVASKQRSGLTQYAKAGYLPAEILYRDEA